MKLESIPSWDQSIFGTLSKRFIQRALRSLLGLMRRRMNYLLLLLIYLFNQNTFTKGIKLVFMNNIPFS